MNLRTRGVTGIWRGPQLSHTVRTGCRRGRGCAADSLREPHDAAESRGSRSGAGRIRSAAGALRNCAYMVARRSKPAPSGGSPTAAICGRPHMNLRTGRVTRTWRGPQLSHTVRAGCRRGKSRAAQLAESAGEGAPQIVCGSRMAPRKAGAPAAEPEEFEARPAPPGTVPTWLPAGLSLRRQVEVLPPQSAGGPI